MTHSSRVVINKGLPVPRSTTTPPDSFIRAKLNASKRQVGNLVLCNLLICPALCGIVILALSVWGESTQQFRALPFPSDIFKLIDSNINWYVTVGFLLLWLLSHCLQVFLLLALATDNLRFCKLYLNTAAPPIWTLILLLFGMAMWSGFQPLERNLFAEFIVSTGFSIFLAANFLSYHVNALADHISFVSIYWLVTERSPLIEYI